MLVVLFIGRCVSFHSAIHVVDFDKKCPVEVTTTEYAKKLAVVSNKNLEDTSIINTYIIRHLLQLFTPYNLQIVKNSCLKL